MYLFDLAAADWAAWHRPRLRRPGVCSGAGARTAGCCSCAARDGLPLRRTPTTSATRTCSSCRRTSCVMLACACGSRRCCSASRASLPAPGPHLGPLGDGRGAGRLSTAGGPGTRGRRSIGTTIGGRSTWLDGADPWASASRTLLLADVNWQLENGLDYYRRHLHPELNAVRAARRILTLSTLVSRQSRRRPRGRMRRRSPAI